MDAIAVSSLLSATQPQLQAQIEALPPLGQDATRCLITGVPRSGKTSMLFHLSCQAAQHGARVVWLCSQLRLEQSPPLLPRGVHRSSPALSNVSFKYVPDITAVKRYAAALHLCESPPAVLVVEDLSDLAGAARLDAARGARDAEITKALAALVDALEHLREARGHACRLFVSDAAGDDGPRGLYLLARWFDAVFALTGSDPSSLALQAVGGSAPHVPPSLPRARLRYSLTHSALTAEGIEWT
ncbi:hypothetical protein Rsub_04224 [Raphidocelis subcapitata]|uniref:ATPase AAA-type core domain-containing protein n=1 Tax=Raphidocelis subcapitata TaxID=307507 RepID=A0A2V0NV21_9CHLO|nr:hypothetical protein Rsub_04224 [Raphidocelis subcapitata]|eukprot:GBF91484.1 hypothetical protein Rsub_04224 [Raphidocelis subcapitata]